MVVGAGLLLYPSFSDYWNSFHQTRVCMTYAEKISDLNTKQYAQCLNSARNYNKALSQKGIVWNLSEEEKEAYERELNIGGTGIMGYIKIQKIGLTLPVYHGTRDSVLQNSIGHLEESSLPVGGEGSHCMLLGHRGLPSARLFTELDRMSVGDRFTLNVLNENLTYEVDHIWVVEPTDLSHLVIEPGKDYCTLITCTPYGINTHRLLVRGHRVENAVLTDKNTEYQKVEKNRMKEIIKEILETVKNYRIRGFITAIALAGVMVFVFSVSAVSAFAVDAETAASGITDTETAAEVEPEKPAEAASTGVTDTETAAMVEPEKPAEAAPIGVTDMEIAAEIEPEKPAEPGNKGADDRREIVFENDSIRIRISFPADAVIPEDTKLKIKETDMDDELYEKILNAYSENSGGKYIQMLEELILIKPVLVTKEHEETAYPDGSRIALSCITRPSGRRDTFAAYCEEEVFPAADPEVWIPVTQKGICAVMKVFVTNDINSVSEPDIGL